MSTWGFWGALSARVYRRKHAAVRGKAFGVAVSRSTHGDVATCPDSRVGKSFNM